MKRLVIATAILIMAIIAYNFIFADRNSRLGVESADLHELSVLAREASFNESINRPRITMERLLVKEGRIAFEVTNTIAARDAIRKLAKKSQGYVSSESQEVYGSGVHISLSVRIPTDTIDEFVRTIESMATKVESKQMSVEDVTEESIDLGSRIGSKRKMETRYEEILQKATTVEDIMKIETQLGNVREEIESMTGRLKHLSSQTSFARLDLTFHEEEEKTVAGFGATLVHSLNDGWNGVLVVVVAIVSIWPLLIIAGVVALIYFRYSRRSVQVSGS